MNTSAVATPRMADELAQHVTHLYRFALARTRDRDWAHDAVQETLLAALENGTSFAGRSALRTWLTAILKHKIIDFQRAHQRGTAIGAVASPYDAVDGVESPAPSNVWSDPDLALRYKRLVTAFDQALAGLPEASAQVFHMREVMGWSTERVSQTLGITQNNCCVILHRARSALRGALDERGFGAEA